MTAPDRWRKPSRCGDTACAEWRRRTYGSVSIRSTTRPEEIVTFTAEEWAALRDAIKDGEFDAE